MTAPGKTPDLNELVKAWTYEHYGVLGLVVLVLIGAAVYAYTNWDKVSHWPGIGRLIGFLSRWRLPQADPNRFSVIVALLENDTNREYQRLIVEELNRFEGVQVLAVNWSIPLEGPVLKEKEEAGHRKALRFLKQKSASVLIWGKVMSLGGKISPRLYWTACHESQQKPLYSEISALDVQFRLPKVFWADLSQILELLIAVSYTEFTAQQGHYVADLLPPFIVRVRTLLEASEDRSEWDANARNFTRVTLADALRGFGDQKGESDSLMEAVTLYRNALNEVSPDLAPLRRAAIRNNFGYALVTLGEREKDPERLVEAVTIFREALKEATRERVPVLWATLQMNLGNAVQRLGERGGDARQLEMAMTAYSEALTVFARERAPLTWAKIQNNLGTISGMLGVRESGKENLTEAVIFFREALKEVTRDRVPLYWAQTHLGLGNALLELGQRESSKESLQDSVTSFREALKELARDRVPLLWASTLHNLGNALMVIAKLEGGTEPLEEAITIFHAALEERTRDRVPLMWAATQNSLGIAFARLGERLRSMDYLERAVASHREALKGFTSESTPLDWAWTQNNLGTALARIGEQQNSAEYLQQAIDTLKKASGAFEAKGVIHHVNRVKANLERIETLLKDRYTESIQGLNNG
jgi:tetratricopeptide (TPR) repeat protein